jgi:ABC-type transporter Mla subunit MlaD
MTQTSTPDGGDGSPAGAAALGPAPPPDGAVRAPLELSGHLEPLLDAFRVDLEKLLSQRVEEVDRRTAEIVGGAWDDAADLLNGANRQREAVAALLRQAIHQSERLLSVADTVLDVVRVDHRRAADVQLAFDDLTGRKPRAVAATGNGLGDPEAPMASGRPPSPAPDVAT